MACNSNRRILHQFPLKSHDLPPYPVMKLVRIEDKHQLFPLLIKLWLITEFFFLFAIVTLMLILYLFNFNKAWIDAWTI